MALGKVLDENNSFSKIHHRQLFFFAAPPPPSPATTQSKVKEEVPQKK